LFISGLTIADVNNDGCPEIYRRVNNSAVSINGCSNSYNEIWNYNLGNIVGIPVIGKIDNDLDWDIAFPVAPNVINVRRATDGAFKFSYTLPSNFPNLLDYDFYSNVLTAYDIDGDGKDELIVRTASQLLALKYNGSSFNVLWNSNYSTGSAIAIGPILNGNSLGIAVNSSGSLLIINASNGSLVAQTNNAYCGAPTITDINGDGIWDVLISECSCGNPYAFSRTNGFSSPIWNAGGCASEPPISSDLIVAKYYLNPDNTGKMVIVEKVRMEFNENYYVYYLNDNLIENGTIEIPIYSPYKMFIFLYENNYPYEVLEKDSILNVIFNTNGSYWSFLIRANDYKVIQYNSPLKLKIDFK